MNIEKIMELEKKKSIRLQLLGFAYLSNTFTKKNVYFVDVSDFWAYAFKYIFKKSGQISNSPAE